MSKIIVFDEDNIKDLARELAKLMTEIQPDDEYYTPAMLADKVPALSKSVIQSQIRAGKYGKKIGEKGRLVAKIQEVKKYNRL